MAPGREEVDHHNFVPGQHQPHRMYALTLKPELQVSGQRE